MKNVINREIDLIRDLNSPRKGEKVTVSRAFGETLRGVSLFHEEKKGYYKRVTFKEIFRPIGAFNKIGEREYQKRVIYVLLCLDKFFQRSIRPEINWVDLSLKIKKELKDCLVVGSE